MSSYNKYNVIISYVPLRTNGKTKININGVTQSVNTYAGNYWLASIPELKLSATGSSRSESYLNIEYLNPSYANPSLFDNYSNIKSIYGLVKLVNNYYGPAINVRRSSDNETIDIGFIDNDLDIDKLEYFCDGTDGFITKCYDISNNGLDAVQTTASAQPKIVENGIYLGEIKYEGAQFLRPLFNYEFDMSNYSVVSVINNYTNNYILGFTVGNNSNTFLSMLDVVNPNYFYLQHYNLSSTTSLEQTEENVNYKGVNVITFGSNGSEISIKNNNYQKDTLVKSSQGLDFIDFDLGGRNGGGYIGGIKSVVLFDNYLTDTDLNLIHQDLTSYYSAFSFKSDPLSPVKIVDDTASDGSSLANTGLSYYETNNEIVVSQWNGAGNYNALLVFDQTTLNLKTTISVNQKSIQDNFVINDIYYVGSQTFYGYDLSGNQVDSFTLPIDYEYQNSVMFFDGYLWAYNSDGLHKINIDTLEVVQIYTKLAGKDTEGLCVCSYGVWLGALKLYDFDGNLIANIGGSETEGMCVVGDKVYINRDEFFHGGTPNGNRLWFYDKLN